MLEKKILIDGKILNYYTNLRSVLKERSPVLVFLHGWMQDGRSFEKIFQILEKKNIPYISLDLPGFGKSQLIDDDMTIEDYAEITQKCIEKLGLKNPILVGHSFGGRISIFLGSFYKNISKIILIGAAGMQREMPLMRKIVLKCAKKIFSVPGLQKIGEKIRKNNISTDARNAGKMEKIFRNTVSRDLTPEMQKNNYPTLMIWGQDDDQVSLEDAKIMSGYMKNSQLKIFPGGHFVFQERPEETTQQILVYIKNK